MLRGWKGIWRERSDVIIFHCIQHEILENERSLKRMKDKRDKLRDHAQELPAL